MLGEHEISIGSKTIVHPTAYIHAEKGPIIIGEGNLIEEYVKIINRNEKPLTIGCYNVFEVGCYSEAQKIGDHNIMESKSRLGPNTIISSGCIIGAMCDVDFEEILPENTVIYGTECNRRRQLEKPPPQTFQLDFLSKILPNYLQVEKANCKASTPTSKPESDNSLSPQS